MIKIKKLYRETYAGEEVVTNMTYQNAGWNYEKEFIPNQITNVTTTSQALVVGGGLSWQEGQFAFDMSHIERHKGGLFGANRLQTYATNGAYKKFKPDFLVVDDDAVEEVIHSGYTKDNIVYAHAKKIIDYPGKLYLIPQDPGWNAGSVATYMACFDGHSKVFLMGFDGVQSNDAFYEVTMSQVFDTYSDVDFVRVSPTVDYYMPESWKYKLNLRQITFRDFVIEADIG
jgi:hypothetical protein